MLWFAVAILTYSCFTCTASASPALDNDRILPRATNIASSPPAWVDEPNGRGTYSLLFACFNTLFLCAWTAFHPNVPCKQSNIRFMISRSQWMLIAIIFPEVVLFTAWDQWWAARSLKYEINRLGQAKITESLPTNFVARDRMVRTLQSVFFSSKDCFLGIVTCNSRI